MATAISFPRSVRNDYIPIELPPDKLWEVVSIVDGEERICHPCLESTEAEAYVNSYNLSAKTTRAFCREVRTVRCETPRRDVPKVVSIRWRREWPPTLWAILEPRPPKTEWYIDIFAHSLDRRARRSVPRDPKVLAVHPNLRRAVEICNQWNAQSLPQSPLLYVAEVVVTMHESGRVFMPGGEKGGAL